MPRASGNAVFISPHLDDAVLACGRLIAAYRDAAVVTVCAGCPKDGATLTDWDAACGFASAAQAVAERREEDRAALSLLGAHPIWLNFCDAQYGETADADAVARSLERVLDDCGADTVVLPLGLFHSDHDLAFRAALRLVRHGCNRDWLGYEDALYRRLPGLLQRRLVDLARHTIVATPAPQRTRGLRARKRQAVDCYASQLRGLGTPGRLGHADAREAERYWALAPAAAEATAS